ncbi:MAG: DNA polymerase III subunit chi [Deltaproteobacteria bacterium]|nr:DNA polymerase III subunit chi [Deltaproteobacteria bacterium]
MTNSATGSGARPRSVIFYDIPADARFPLVSKLASAAWEKGRRLIVRAFPEQAPALDEHLWVFREEAFVPHEVALDAASLLDPEARIVIVTRDVAPIAADILVQLAPCELAFARGFETVIDLVDATDDLRLNASRARFKAWSDAGLRPELKKTA